VVVETMRGTARMYWWGLMRIDLYGVKAAMVCERLANNKKSSTRSNSFSRIFIFWSFPEDFEIPNFFSGPAKKDYEASFWSFEFFGSFSLVQWIISHVPSWCSTSAVQDSTQSPSFIYRIPSISLISA
jgi:hypothetical protein